MRVCLTDTKGLLFQHRINGYGRYEIGLRRFIRYIRVGGLLHLVSVAGISAFIVFGLLFKEMTGQSPITLKAMGCFALSVYGLVLVGFSQLDAFSRFQNYKQVKDLLYKKGFKNRVVRLFCLSRCQRDALAVAAGDLGMGDRLKDFYKCEGYRWFHFFPEFTFKNPGVFLSKNYWKKTLFAPVYHLRYFLW